MSATDDLFPSGETMNAYYGGLRPASIERDSGTCGPDNPTAENEYLSGGNVLGRMLCYEVDGRPRIVWTNDESTVVSTVHRTDTESIGPLVTWWEVPGYERAVDPATAAAGTRRQHRRQQRARLAAPAPAAAAAAAPPIQGDA